MAGVRLQNPVLDLEAYRLVTLGHRRRCLLLSEYIFAPC